MKVANEKHLQDAEQKLHHKKIYPTEYIND